ncbi:MAG TPA: histone deacetylase [bacterium (Candidatus Stahlbacteria)]|nr:histone deacetylase [Candidatus Stahlbacteria bacterium]
MTLTRIPIIYHERCLGYNIPGHPESPERISQTKAHLEVKGYQFHIPDPCAIEDITSVHTQAHVEGLKTGNFFDLDTPSVPGIYEIARISCGGAILASEVLGFSLTRPPGHHATRRQIMGFCYLNNIAIAVAKLVKKGERIAILDIDCHHGNGTEDIFAYNREVFYCSLHQSPLYPGTGLASYENVFNLPLPPGIDGKGYLRYLDQALNRISDFNPDRLAISAGFDTFRSDPLTNLGLEVDDYYTIGKMIAELRVPVFSVLEGGYASDLPLLIENYLRGLCGV